MLIDGTVITSEGTKCELLSFGYNPAGARKRQITIFLAVTEGENIPVHLRIVRGNVRAYKIFREILSDLKSGLLQRSWIMALLPRKACRI